MSQPGVGYEYPAQDVSWLKRDVLLFNLSIGCTVDELHFLYELHDKFSAFPTYPLALVFKGNAQEVIDFYSAEKSISIPGVPTLDPTRLVDGQRLIRFLKPLPTSSAGRGFQLRTRVLGAYDKGKAGTVLETEILLVDTATQEPYTQIIGSLFYVGQGGWNGPRGPKGLSTPANPGRDPDGTINIQIPQEAAHLYRLNGDYNPLHATPEPGKQMGYGGMIVHGVLTYNWVAHALLKELGASNPANIKELEARFKSAVKPGDLLNLTYWRMGPDAKGWEEIRFETTVAGNGQPCLSNGRALIRTATDELKEKL